MRKMILLLAFAYPAFGAEPAPKEAEELKLFAGYWGVEKAEGMDIPTEVYASVVFEVKGTLASATIANEKRVKYTTFKLDPSKSPKEIDFAEADKDGKPTKNTETVKALYKIDGEKIVLAVGAPGQPRPKEIKPVASEKGDPDSGILVVTFKKLTEDEVKKRRESVSPISIERAQIQMRVLETASKAYAARNGGTYPEKLEDLLKPPDGGRPFIEVGKDVLIDPWGQQYQMKIDKDKKGDEFIIVFTINPKTKEKIHAKLPKPENKY